MSGSDTQVVDTAGYIQEFRAESARWPLPADEAYPAEPPGDTSGMWEVGTGASAAAHVWKCAWVQEWLATFGVDDARADTALTALARYRESPEWTALDDLGRQIFDQDYQAAQLGDPTKMRNTAEVQCA